MVTAGHPGDEIRLFTCDSLTVAVTDNPQGTPVNSLRTDPASRFTPDGFFRDRLSDLFDSPFVPFSPATGSIGTAAGYPASSQGRTASGLLRQARHDPRVDFRTLRDALKGPPPMSPSPPGRGRLAGAGRGRRVLTVTSSVCVIVAGTAGPAWAHHAEIKAAVSCRGRVTFTATAWAGKKDKPGTVQDENALSRTNPDVVISYATDGHGFRTLARKAIYAFTPAGRYSFTDSFQLPAPLPHQVIVRAGTAALWANGRRSSKTQQTPPLSLPACASRPAALGLPASPAAVSLGGAVPGGLPLLLGGGLLTAMLLAAGAWAARRVMRM